MISWNYSIAQLLVCYTVWLPLRDKKTHRIIRLYGDTQNHPVSWRRKERIWDWDESSAASEKKIDESYSCCDINWGFSIIYTNVTENSAFVILSCLFSSTEILRVIYRRLHELFASRDFHFSLGFIRLDVVSRARHDRPCLLLATSAWKTCCWSWEAHKTGASGAYRCNHSPQHKCYQGDAWWPCPTIFRQERQHRQMSSRVLKFSKHLKALLLGKKTLQEIVFVDNEWSLCCWLYTL